MKKTTYETAEIQTAAEAVGVTTASYDYAQLIGMEFLTVLVTLIFTVKYIVGGFLGEKKYFIKAIMAIIIGASAFTLLYIQNDGQKNKVEKRFDKLDIN